MSVALAEFARRADPEGRKTLVILLGNAGWHVSARLRVPRNAVLHCVPPHTPELQPVESLWPLVREGIANRTFDTPDELEACLSERCRYLMGHPEVDKGRVGWCWAARLR
jgi:transposase